MTGPALPSLARGLAAALLVASTAHADESPTPDGGAGAAQLHQVVVSARRQQEDPQRVPVSVDAFTEDELRREDLRTITALQDKVPGLAICCASGRANFSFLRGIQGVQAYFAETPLMPGTGASAPLSGSAMYFDLENLSVLKGPQGTLFGISTNGGAVLFAPRRPGSRFGGQASIELGDYGRRIVEGVVDVPVNDMLKLRVGLQSAHVDGYVVDEASGLRLGAEDYTIARLVLGFRPAAAINNELFINHYASDNTQVPYVPVAVRPGSPAALRIGPGLADAVEQQRRLGYYRLLGSSLPVATQNRGRQRQTNVANITTLQLGQTETGGTAQLKNILGFERLSTFTVTDTDGTPFRILDDNGPGAVPSGAQRQLSDELQLQGQALQGRLDYTLGLFHARSRPGAAGMSINDLRDSFGIQSYAATLSGSRTSAIYGQASYALDDLLQGLSATAGYRHTDDRRWMERSSGILIASAGNLDLPNARQSLAQTTRGGSYTLGLSYRAAPRSWVYLNNSKGLLNGGFDTAAQQARDASFGPESLNNIELGLKSEQRLGGMQARLNLAAYYGFYRDGQVSVTTVVNAGTPQQALAVLTRNASRGVVRGLEWQLELVPNTRLHLGFFGSLMSNRYDDYRSLDAEGRPVDLSGTPFVYVPRLKYGLSATAFWPLDAAQGLLSATLAFTHQDGLIGTSTPQPQWYDRIPANNKLDASAEWDHAFAQRGLSARLFITNLLRNRDANGGFGVYQSIGVLGYAPAVPRMIGLRLQQTL